MPISKTNALFGTGMGTRFCSVKIEVLDDTNSSKVAADVVSFAERMHRSLAIPVSVAKFTIGAVTALHVSSGVAANLPEGCVMCTELADS